MGQQEQGLLRASEEQVSALIEDLQNRNVDTTESNDIAYQAAFLDIRAEGDFVGEKFAVRISRDENGLRIIHMQELSTNE